MKNRFTAFLLAGILSCHSWPAMAAEQSQASYEDAFRTISTSPSYVLITVVDARTGQARQVCTTANFLLGAIHREYGLAYTPADAARAIEIARQNQDHIFRFRQQAALDNIPVTYSDAELQAARDFLAPLPPDTLKEKFSSGYANRRLDTTGYARDAIACVLIERGLSPAMADRSGQVIVAR